MAKWLVIDFETMGTDSVKCAAVDLSAIVVDTDKFVSSQPYTLRDVANVKRWKLSVADQVQNYGFEIEPETVAWWQSQDAEVRAKVKPLKTDLTVPQFVESFHSFLIESPKIDYWWSRANTFDPIILTQLFKAVGKGAHIAEYLKHWRVRDLRTYIDAKFDFSTQNGFIPVKDEEFFNKVFKQHDSSWDVIADVLRLQTIARAENDLEMISK